MDSNLFQGLEKLGLGNLTDVNLYEEQDEKKSEATEIKEEKVINEADFLFDKSFECPVCEAKFKSKTPKIGKVKKLDSDTDLRPTYQNVDLLKYDAIVCNECGYAALTRYFDHLSYAQGKLIRDVISPKFSSIDDGSDFYTYDDAILRHQLALANAVVKRARNSEKGYICLKLSWLVRGKIEKMIADNDNVKDEEVLSLRKQEAEFTKQAYEGLKSAMSQESFPICGLDEWQYIYLVAELARKTKDYQTSVKLIGDILISKMADSKLKDKARDIRDRIKAEVKSN